jgi:hypothetical protein
VGNSGFYGKFGIVPLALITFLDDPIKEGLFNHFAREHIRISHIIA